MRRTLDCSMFAHFPPEPDSPTRFVLRSLVLCLFVVAPLKISNSLLIVNATHFLINIDLQKWEYRSTTLWCIFWHCFCCVLFVHFGYISSGTLELCLIIKHLNLIKKYVIASAFCPLSLQCFSFSNFDFFEVDVIYDLESLHYIYCILPIFFNYINFFCFLFFSWLKCPTIYWI